MYRKHAEDKATLAASGQMYMRYLSEQQQKVDLQQPISESFLVWHRDRKWNPKLRQVDVFGMAQKHKNFTKVCACRYWYELSDGYLGQWAVTQLPHMHYDDLLPTTLKYVPGMEHFVGILDYLLGWKYVDPDLIATRSGYRFRISALPCAVHGDGTFLSLPDYRPGEPVFVNDKAAFEYVCFLMDRDLTYRGHRDARMHTWHMRMQAFFLLYRKVSSIVDEHEYELYKQQWSHMRSSVYEPKASWSAEQQRVFDIVHL